MLEETFSRGDSFIHRLHPQTRLATVATYSVLVACCRQFHALLAALAVSLLLMVLARLDFRAVLRRITLANKLIALIWIILPLSAGQWLHGLSSAAIIALKCNAVLLALIALAATCSIDVIGHVLGRWMVPDKLVYLLLISYRYLFIIKREYDKLTTAARLRGFNPGFNLHTYRTYAFLLGMLLVKSVLRGERVYQAMICRGFIGKLYCLRQFRFSHRDFIFLGVAPVAIAAIAIMEWKEIISLI